MIYCRYVALSHFFVKMILTGLTEVSLFVISGQAVSSFSSAVGSVLMEMGMGIRSGRNHRVGWDLRTGS
jgi:hypothetical protein